MIRREMKESGRKKYRSAMQSEISIVKIDHFLETCHTDEMQRREHARDHVLYGHAHKFLFVTEKCTKFELNNLKQL